MTGTQRYSDNKHGCGMMNERLFAIIIKLPHKTIMELSEIAKSKKTTVPTVIQKVVENYVG